VVEDRLVADDVKERIKDSNRKDRKEFTKDAKRGTIGAICLKTF
jgi:hypothetical protein